MKNELIKLENDYYINYQVQIDSKNRRLNLYVQDSLGRLSLDGYFRKSDIWNLGKLDEIHCYESGELLETYNVTIFKEFTKIGCCTIPNNVLKSIQDKFKKMK